MVMAFQPLSQHQQQQAQRHARLQTLSSSSDDVRRFLHPDQAADLEACAYDLMKEALEVSRPPRTFQVLAEAGEMVDPNTMEATTSSSSSSSSSSSMGPVAWCRRRLWPFARGTIEQQQQNLRP